MILTEPEAAQKVCPHLPADIEVEPVNNVVAHRVVRFPLCIASACSQWRWHYRVMRHLEKDNSDRSEGGPATGYCGLAGAPPRN